VESERISDLIIFQRYKMPFFCPLTLLAALVFMPNLSIGCCMLIEGQRIVVLKIARTQNNYFSIFQFFQKFSLRSIFINFITDTYVCLLFFMGVGGCAK
jgi:hypothetical protein